MDRDEWLQKVTAVRAAGGQVTFAALQREGMAALASEMAEEASVSLSRLGARLDALVDALIEATEVHASTPDEVLRSEAAAEHARLRKALLDARWEMKVVREALRLRGGEAPLNEFWPVPPRLG